LVRAKHVRRAQRRYPVLNHAAPADLVKPDERAFLAVFEIVLETRIDPAVKIGFEVCIINRLGGWLVPPPLIPGILVISEFLTGFLLQ